MSISKQKLPFYLLPLLFFVGLAGMIFFKSFFVPCSPLLLLTCFFFIVRDQQAKGPNFLRVLILTAAAGFGLELVGVTTGKVFGIYWYGKGLGPLVAGVPPLIGINWCMLLLGASAITSSFIRQGNILFQALLTAAIMTLLDAAMEPVCSNLDMWYWGGGYAPLRNYVSWFCFSFMLAMVYFTLEPNTLNRTARLVFVLQSVFFISLTALKMANIFL